MVVSVEGRLAQQRYYSVGALVVGNRQPRLDLTARPVSCLTIPHQHKKVRVGLERGLRGEPKKGAG